VAAYNLPDHKVTCARIDPDNFKVAFGTNYEKQGNQPQTLLYSFNNMNEPDAVG
jgi:hypothetical protein